MNPVVHFEMPYDNRERRASFSESTFGWWTQMLGEDMGNYVVATTGDTDEGGPKKPGIRESVRKVTDAGGTVLGEPVEVPGVGQYVSFTDTAGNRGSMLQPIPRNWHAPQSE